MEYTFLTTASFLGLCISTAVLLRIPYAFAPLFVLTFLGIGGYTAASFAHLHVFLQTSLYTGLISFLPALFFFLRKKPPCSTLVLSASHAALQCFITWYYYGAKLHYYDEFYWAALARDLFQSGALLQGISPIMESLIPKVHPPFMMLLQSFFSTIPGKELLYQESSVGVACLTVLLAFFCLVVQFCHKHMPLFHALAVGIFALILVRVIGTNLDNGVYVMGYVENYQAALFSLGICLTCLMSRSYLQFFALLSTVLILTMTKATSHIFAFCIISLYFLLTLYAFWKERKQEKPSTSLKDFGISLGICALLFTSVVAFKIHWTLQEHRAYAQYAQLQVPAKPSPPAKDFTPKSSQAQEPSASKDVQKSPQTKISLEDVTNTSSIVNNWKGLPWEHLRTWLWGLLELPLLHSPYIPARYMPIFFTLLPLYVYMFFLMALGYFFFGIRYKKEDIHVLSFLSLSLAVWFFLRFIIALHFHSPEEIARVASYARYMSVFVAPILVHMTIVYHIRVGTAYVKNKSIYYLSLLFFPIGLILICGFIPWLTPRHVPLPEKRLTMERAATYLENHTPKGARIWFISQQKNIETLSIARYFIFKERRTDLALPWQIPTSEEGIINLDALLPLAQSKHVEYIFLWNEKTNLHYRLAGNVYESAKKPILIPLNKTK